MLEIRLWTLAADSVLVMGHMNGVVPAEKAIAVEVLMNATSPNHSPEVLAGSSSLGFILRAGWV